MHIMSYSVLCQKHGQLLANKRHGEEDNYQFSSDTNDLYNLRYESQKAP